MTNAAMESLHSVAGLTHVVQETGRHSVWRLALDTLN